MLNSHTEDGRRKLIVRQDHAMLTHEITWDDGVVGGR